VGLYQKLSRNITLLDPVVCRYLTMMLDGVLVLEVGSHNFSWHGTHLFFLIFINDLPECVTSNTRLLTDDAIVYKEIKSQSGMQQILSPGGDS
jgi:hypothetical protein